ncbi:chemotaxis protein CheR [Candidimonas sp. SYP-B2681]|uniref:CheR family methyltransferase n=1 Tax=Candidimonas sp. SYP-B2681 TaxID=2497686 RepID=UPI000F88C6B9|nr:protein-glutamate O-methyltransferase CheR [Candidimonas sp. SYP-B2681]RTZ48087.1 chemotaxis protein CheR [Candidimonas sp. SYP-B2681]
MSELAQFETLLKQTMGLNAKSVGLAMIERAVRDRCAVNGALDIAAYWRQVKESPAELQELIELVVVPETWFFRNGEAFKALARLALSHTLRSDRRLRILSLPCSTGEEPYSMAMALLDAGVSSTRFHIDALDISACCIAMAQRATYGMNSFRGKDLEFRDRHFVAVGERYALAETVRSKVRFRRGNLFEPALLADESGYDFIFCRNVLIYFGDAEQAQAVSVLNRLLSETGMLFVGPSEGGVLFREKMVSANLPLAFAFRKTAAAPPSQTNSALPVSRSAESKPDVPARARSAWTPRPGAAPARPVYGQGQGQAQGRASLAPRRSDVVPASAPVSRESSDNDPIAVAARLADQGQLREAAQLCKRHVQDHGPTAAAFYLLGLVSDAAGHHREAREHYRKTLYLDPDHTEALVHLAALLEMHGDTAGARQMNDRARRSTTRHLN